MGILLRTSTGFRPVLCASVIGTACRFPHVVHGLGPRHPLTRFRSLFFLSLLSATWRTSDDKSASAGPLLWRHDGFVASGPSLRSAWRIHFSLLCVSCTAARAAGFFTRVRRTLTKLPSWHAQGDEKTAGG